MENHQNLQIREIYQADARTLGIVWSDARRDYFDVVDLRRRCPCASCIDEWTKKPLLKPDSVSDSVRPSSIKSVGQYAMQISFNDGHSTGIYPYSMLRDLGEKKPG